MTAMLATPPAFTFGDRVRRLRLTLNLSQEELADALGVSPGSVGNYETAEHPPRTWRVIRNSVELRFGPVAAEWVFPA